MPIYLIPPPDPKQVERRRRARRRMYIAMWANSIACGVMLGSALNASEGLVWRFILMAIAMLNMTLWYGLRVELDKTKNR